MRNLGVYDIPLGLMELNPENERQSWQREGLEALLNSIKMTGGNVTPGICEYLHPDSGIIEKEDILRVIDGEDTATDNADDNHKFRVLGGNRRYLCNTILGFEKMRSRVLVGLSDEERLEIQFIENATKTKIPPYQIADSMWELYLYRLGLELGEEKPDYADYWNIPEQIKSKFSMGSFAKVINKPSSTIRTAFNYQRINKRLKDLVATGKIPYSTAAELGRIEDKNTQMVEMVRARTIYGKLNRSIMSGWITQYLNKDKEIPVLDTLIIEPKADPFKGLASRLSGFVRLLKKVTYFGEQEPDLLEAQGMYQKESLDTILSGIKSRLDKLNTMHRDEPAYISALASYERSKEKKPSLVSQILSGEVKIEADDKVLESLDISQAEYHPSLSLDNIFPCKNQPRKTFETKKVEEMAETMKKYGVLQTILVRPKDDAYEIVVGETRYRAAKKAGLGDIDALICPMDDTTAQIVRIEEDLYEEVILSERAEKLHDMYNLKLKSNKDMSLDRFAQELGIGTHTLRDAIKFASLDDRLKTLHKKNLLGYSHLITLYGVKDPDQRFEYAAASIILGKSHKQLKEDIYVDKYQGLLPFHNFDHHTAKLDGLKSAAVDLVDKSSRALYEKKVNVVENTSFDLMENLTRREHFKYMHEMRDILDNI